MPNLVLRPLFVFLTLAMLVGAFFQVTGRLMFAVLDKLEPGINHWLAPQGVTLNGLSGDWRRINPVIRIAEVRLPAGRIRGLHVEVDWLESLVRNRLVAQRISLDGGHLHLERGAEGWRLMGMAGGGDFNPFGTLYHSDQIDVSLQVGFADAQGSVDEAGDLAIRYRATNRRGEHRHRLSVRNLACETGCVVRAAVDEVEAVPLLRQRQIQASLEGANLKLPGPLLAGEGGRIDTLEGYWWRAGDASAGEARVRLTDLVINGKTLQGGFDLAARGEGDVHHLALDGLRVVHGEDQWSLPGFWLTLENGPEDSLLMAWTERLETGPAFDFVTALVPRRSAVFRWLNALQVRATALNVHAFVRFPSLETGYLATVRDLAVDGYNGAPWIRGASGELLGANRMVQLAINAENIGVQFPDMFHERWTMEHLSGRLQAFVSAGYFGLKGNNLRAALNGSHVSGGFAVTRPRDARYRERLSLLLNVDHTTVPRAKQYIPYRLPAGLPEWLESGPRSGELSDVAFAYHGQVHTRPGELARRVAFAARIEAGHVRYHPDWPDVRGLVGHIGVDGRDVRIQVEEGASLENTNLAGSFIRLVDNAAYADIDLKSDSSADQALAFIRSTPLAGWMPFVTPDWVAAGSLHMAGRLRVPLRAGEAPAEAGEAAAGDDGLEVDMDIALHGVDLDLPGYGVALDGLRGDVHYTYPYAIRGSGVTGRIFDRPAVFGASSDASTVTFHVNGQAPYQEVLALLEVRDPGFLVGSFDFLADLHIEMGDAVSRLVVLTDLTGLGLDLPGEFAKAPDEAVPAELELSFLPVFQSVRFRYGTARGWMHVKEVPLRGAVGFGVAPPVTDAAGDRMVLAGRIAGFRIDEVIPDDEPGEALLALPVRLAGLTAGLIDVNGVPFREVTLTGEIGATSPATLDLEMASRDLAGTLRMTGDAPLRLDLSRLRLPASGAEDDADPLDVGIIPELVDADVTVGRFEVGEEDYGRWSFRLRPEPGGVEIQDLEAELRGLRITADRLYWDAAANRTRFVGTLAAEDLATVLPQWGYAPSVTTEKARLVADLEWRGSPAAVDLTRWVGEAEFEAENGRFLEVTQGTDAMKIFSLVNFSKIARRLNFDFSDVVGEGVSFDTLTARTEFQEGTMQFLEPMSVKGSGSSFRIAGRVDLLDGRLDNEMIVTLPVTKGLPWYAAYVAIANPLAGLGVLVGERVLRRPLEQFSSAKYQISGTLDDPELTFVSVWDTRMDQPQASLQPIEGEGVEGEAPAQGDAEQDTPDTQPVEEETKHAGATG